MSQPIIIVGAGSSGAVLANRLSARSDRAVLLLEAGPDYLPQALPDDLRDGTRNSMTQHDWQYAHKPNHNTMLSPLPRGRVVGGSSAVNTCVALRGQPEDYDEWAELGLHEWSFQHCLPAFRRLERDLDFGQRDYHGSDGPLPVRRHPPNELVPVQAAFMQACEELGLPACADSNAPGEAGFGAHAMNKLEGRRISAAEAYLTASVRARPNLRIRPDTLVRRVLFREQRVVGVEVETRGAIERIEAGEVILCAGAINTPGILLRSGVGPDREVRRLQCEPVLDAPAVGARLLDHPATGIFVLARARGTVDFSAPILQTALRYASGFSTHRADMVLQAASFTLLPRRPPVFAVVMHVGKPSGHGELRLRSADPHERPIINSRFFEDEHDRALIRDALRRGYALLRTRALSALGRPIVPLPVLARFDRTLDFAVSYLSASGYHPCGTVPMGTTPSERAAVDAHGRVFGLQGLRVVDASVMPTVPSSNIHLPTLMVAERMAPWLDAEL